MKCPEDIAKAAGHWSLLVVDADPHVGDIVQQLKAQQTKKSSAKADPPFPIGRFRTATSVDAALAEMQSAPADVLLINLQINDNAGLELIRTIRRRWPRANCIAVSRAKRSELCLEAWRAGAADMLMAPLQPQDIQRTFTNLTVRQAEVDRLANRNERLRVVCRRLNKARHEISQQVDLLCNDLVRAYQEMAQQLNHTQMAADFADFVRSELELEGILRRTMEWILRKLGPINAAVYLPNGEQFFSLGAYLNLDTQADAPLIDSLGRTIVELARRSTLITLSDDRQIDDLFGNEAESFHGRNWLAMGCQTKKECLAVLVIFKRQPTDESSTENPARGLIEAIAPILAERIEQALGFHHRLHPFPEDEPDDDGGQEMDAG